MRKIKVLSAVLLIMIITLGLFGCKIELPEPSDISSLDEAISMDFYAKDDKVTLKVGEFAWMDVNIKIDYEYALQWTSSNPKIATVDSSGRVDAVSPGKATITAHAKKASVDFNVTVLEGKPEKLLMSNAIVSNDTTVKENSLSEKDANLYRILINGQTNCATVFTYNADGVYNVAVRSMVCSVGKNGLTLEDSYLLSSKDRWNSEDDKYYQYYCTFSNETQELVMSSSSYESQSAARLIAEDFNKLGTAYTEGNIRLCADDAKWIYDNCPEGTAIKVTYSSKNSTLGKPSPLRIPENSKNSGWDPTDSHEDNPYRKLKPSFEGVDNTYVCLNGVFDAYSGVVAYDSCGNVVSDKITIDGNVICSKEGVYIITYRYTDNLGRTGRADRLVTVLSAEEYNKLPK